MKLSKKNKTYLLYGGVAVAGIVSIYGMYRFKIYLENKIVDALLNREIERLHPSVRKKFRKLLRFAKKRGYTVIITSGYRSFKKQNQLYERNSKNARAGLSMHNYGLAIDINLRKNGRWWRKSTPINEWKATGIPAYAKGLGMEWGGDFKTYRDPVHFEYDHGLAGSQLLQMAYTQYGNNLNNFEGNKINIT